MKKTYRKFEGTTIHWSKTQGEIIQLLLKTGISNSRFSNTDKGIVLEFVAMAKEINKPIPIRMILPMPSDKEQEKNRLHRVLFWYLDNKFEALRSGLVEELTKEFLPFIAFKTKNGVDITLYEALKEEGNAILGDSNFPLLPKGKEGGEIK